MSSELIVRIGANADGYANELKKVKSQTENLEKNLAKVAKVSGAAFAVGTVAIVAATKAASDFESKFSNVVTLLDKSSFSTKSLEKGIGDLKQGIIEIGQESGESFDSLNGALFDLISSGVPAEEAIDTLRVSTQLAAAGATDTAVAVTALTATLTSFGDKAGTAQEISEKFFTAQKFGVTTVGELASEFSKVAGVANTLGISFDETLASLSALTADGAKPTNVAATQLKATLTSIINVQKTLGNESMAVQEALSLQNLESKGLVGVLDELKIATGGNIPEMQRLLGSAESLSVALSLTGAQSDLVAKQVKAMADEQERAAVFAEALSVKQQTTEKTMARFRTTLDSLAIVLGEQFAPALGKAADFLGSLVKALANNPLLVKTAALFVGIATAVGGIAAAGALASTAFLQIRAAMLALNISTKVLTVGIKGLVGATGLGLVLIVLGEVYANWETIFPLMEKVFKKFANFVIPTIEMIANGFISGFNTIISAASKFGNSYLIIWKGILKSIIGVASGIGNILLGVFTLDTDKISKGIKMAKDAVVNGAKDTISQVRAEIEKDNAPIIAPIKIGKLDVSEAKKEIEDKSKDLKIEAPATTSKSEGGSSDTVKDAKETTKALSEEDKKRVESSRAALEEINARAQGASDQEIEFIKKKNELVAAENAASMEENELVRSSELELIAAQKEQLLQQERDFRAKKTEEEAIANEQDKALKDELKELNAEERALLDEQELEQLRTQILTKGQIEDEFVKEKIAKEIEQRNNFLKDEKKHGIAVATFNKELNSEEVKNAQSTAQELVRLQSSKNETLKGIGKAAAVSQIAIDTARGAIAAYSSLAGIPIVGPVLGAAAAGSLIAFGAERTAQTLAANRGGVVPGNLRGAIPGQDSVAATLTPGELVVPDRNFDEVVNSVANQRLQSGATARGEDSEPESRDNVERVVFEIDIKDRAGEMITLDQREGRALGLINEST